MARSSFCMMTSILLLSLVILASASDYGHDPKAEGKEKLPTSKQPNYQEQKPTDKYDQTPEPEDKVKILPKKPIKYVQPKADQGKVKIILPAKPNKYYPQPKPEGKDKILSQKPVYEKPKPKPKGEEKLVPTKPYYKEPVPKGNKNLLPTTNIGVQGIVFCKSGLKYFPLPGAVAKITCLAVAEEVHKTSYFTVQSQACDSKGYFFATITPPKSLGNCQWEIKDCKAYLDHSPLETCKVATDVNNGVKGALLSSYSILPHKNMKLYSVGPFFYTSEPYKTPAPKGY